jgi:23S rRNA (guanosine2251-2'-O)-methyltransferase
VDLLYGRNSVKEALRAGRSIRRLLIADSAHGLEPLLVLAHRRGVPVEVLQAERRQLDRLVGAHHQGVVAEAEPFAYVHIEDILQAVHHEQVAPLILALDSLQDPQNFGTLLRTAQAVGVHGVILPQHRTVSVTPAVSNASAGAVEHLRVARVTNLVRTLRELKLNHIWVFGLSVSGQQPYWSADLGGPLTLVVGSEGSGLGRLVAETCDASIHIPMAPGSVESLNAAVAGSLVLYEAFRQRTAA